MGELRDLETLGVSVPHEGVKILGVFFYFVLRSKKAWEKTEAKVKQKLGLWHSRFLSTVVTSGTCESGIATGASVHHTDLPRYVISK